MDMLLCDANVYPYFQPIVSADTCSIVGYEVLGRYSNKYGEVCSLGDFFRDPFVDPFTLLHIDRAVRRKAMVKYAAEGCDKDLYLNMPLKWLAVEDFKGEPHTLQWARELGIPPEHLVIEITEEEFNITKDLARFISGFIKAGCRIALDDYGKGASNTDRLAQLSPSMIKIAMAYIQKSPQSFHHRAYINSLASFAEHVGIEILCEGIETLPQLDVCIETGGRYFQGFLLARPQPHLGKAVVDTSVLAPSFGRLISTVRNRVSQANALRRTLNNYVLCYVAENLFVYGKSDADNYLRGLLNVLPKNVLRLFLCNSEGMQVAGNAERREDSVVSTVPAGANWMWRGFFQEAMYMFASGQQSGVTGAYRDMLTKERIFTYFTAMGSDLFLFVDVRRMALSVASYGEPLFTSPDPRQCS